MMNKKNKMDELLRRVLNDEAIFHRKVVVPQDDWSKWKKVWKNQGRDGLTKVIQDKLSNIKDEKARAPYENLLKMAQETPNLLSQLFEYLDCYGSAKCNLSNTDDFGKVIERYGRERVEQFFLDKIKRERDRYKKRALVRLLEYVKEMYNAHISPLEIAYFVRKVDSLTTLWEVFNEQPNKQSNRAG